jgi:hypothetical protein
MQANSASTAEMVKLLSAHVALGQPLPFDVYDETGRLLLRRGFAIAEEPQLERLVERGLYCREPDFVAVFAPADAAPAAVPQPQLESPWLRLLELQNSVASALSSLAAGRGADAVAALVDEVDALCALDADAMLAAITLLRHPRHSVRHAVCAALLVAMMTRRAGLPEPQRHGATAGALTMNLGMIALQDALYSQREPLDAAQQAEVRAHPGAGVALLRRAGIADPHWLLVVACHHENADGSGYPRGLRSPALGAAAQIVGLADRYCAMLAERAYRPGAPADQALKLLLGRLGTTVDADVVKLLVAEVGHYPPGCPVRLANNESGIVLRRTRDGSARVVKALRSPLRKVYEDGPRRLTSQPAFAVDRVIGLAELDLEVDPSRLWDATARVHPG